MTVENPKLTGLSAQHPEDSISLSSGIRSCEKSAPFRDPSLMALARMRPGMEVFLFVLLGALCDFSAYSLSPGLGPRHWRDSQWLCWPPLGLRDGFSIRFWAPTCHTAGAMSPSSPTSMPAQGQGLSLLKTVFSPEA